MPNTFSHVFEKIARRSGFHGLRLHDLRHSYATILLQQGVHPKIVQERLGHSSITLTSQIRAWEKALDYGAADIFGGEANSKHSTAKDASQRAASRRLPFRISREAR